MRTWIGALLMGALPGCVIVVDTDKDDPDTDTVDTDTVDTDTDTVDTDTDTVEDTGTTTATCGIAAIAQYVSAMTATTTNGCGHASFGVQNLFGSDELVLTGFLNTAGAGRQEPEAPYTVGTIFTGDLATQPAAEVDLRLQLGSDQWFDVCNDVFSGERVTRQTYDAVSGTVAVEVTTASDTVEPWGESAFQGTVRLRDVVVSDGTATCELPDLDLVGVNMGWFPG